MLEHNQLDKLQPHPLTCSSVAAQVHCEQTTAAMSPVLTLRPAVLKCSLVMCVPPYLAAACAWFLFRKGWV